MLPLSDLPEGWEVGESGDRHLETFNAGNLYEKIDGRAESFVQYDVVGMAYTFYHPIGSEANEVQVYIFELGNPLKALGKYGTEKPEEAEPLELGTAGYTSGASVFFHAKSYYVQIVPTSESEEFREFATDASPGGSPTTILPGSAPDPSASDRRRLRRGRSRRPSPPAIWRRRGGGGRPDRPLRPAARGARARTTSSTSPRTSSATPSSPTSSWPRYAEDDLTWQAFVRPYATPDRAREVFDQYRGEAEAFDAKISEVRGRRGRSPCSWPRTSA